MERVDCPNSETSYICLGIDQNLRIDGRRNKERRNYRIDLNVVSNSHGSAAIHINDEMTVLITINASIEKFDGSQPWRAIGMRLDYPTKTLDFRTENVRKSEIENALSMLVCDELIEPESMMIVANRWCWRLDVNISIVSDNGNIVETCFNGLRTLLSRLELPRIVSTNETPDNLTDLIISSNPEDVTKLNLDRFPFLFSLFKVRAQFIVDPVRQEEDCSDFVIHMTFDASTNRFGIFKVSQGIASPQDIDQAMTMIRDMPNEYLMDGLNHPDRIETSSLFDI